MSVEAPGIRILEDRVIDQIAAGEVVDRPASVVKELVENALDATAGQVEIILKEGGCALIQVADDGEGMSEQDALMSIERHATSKLRGMEDLVGIHSFGFRGEALPSIAAVSRFELLTRRREDHDGTRVRIHAGQLVDVRPAGAAAGTVVRVRNLFYSLPARKAFMRGASTELGHCVQVVIRAALGRPDVGFVLAHGGRTLVDAPVAATMAQRAAAVMGPDARHLSPIDEGAGELRLHGLVSPAGIHRATGNGAIYLFVNGRWVRDLVLRRAVQQAYQDLVPRGRYPIAVLNLSIPGDGVDVNVHPTKAEVQFRDPAGVGTFVARTLREAILGQAGRGEGGPPHLRARERGATPLPFSGPSPAPSSTPPPGRESDQDRVEPHTRGGDSAPLPSSSAASLPHADPQPAPIVAEEGPAVVAAAPPAPVRLLGVIGHRWAVGDAGGALWVVDAGRAVRRLEAQQVSGPGRRLLAPIVLRWSEADVKAVEYHADALSEAGVEAVRFSATEVAVRSLPGVFGSVGAEEVLRTALLALRRHADVRKTWGSRLPPAEIPADLPALEERLAEVEAAGIPLGPRCVDPDTLTEL